MISKYDILQSISQGEDFEMSPENRVLVSIADDIYRAATSSSDDEAQSCDGKIVIQSEREKRAAEEWACTHEKWMEYSDMFNIGIPGPSGSESDTYVSIEGFVYKVNNLLHTNNSIIDFLTRTLIYNIIFPDSAYQFFCFTGFKGRSVFPVVRQRYIKDCVNAKQNEIDCYMYAMGFEKLSEGKFSNSMFLVWDLFPKNVLKDESGDLFVIDAEICYLGNSIM